MVINVSVQIHTRRGAGEFQKRLRSVKPQHPGTVAKRPLLSSPDSHRQIETAVYLLALCLQPEADALLDLPLVWKEI